MAIVTITVSGEILDLDNSTPAVGTVTFKTLTELRDTVDNIVYEPATYTVTLDGLGQFTVNLPATDSPDITPTGWLYQVYISTTTWRETFYISLPTTLAPAVDFADLTPVEPDDGTGCTPDGTACAPISLVAEVAALEGDITGLEGDITALEGQVVVLDGEVNALQVGINNLDASQITTGTLAYQRLGGTIAEADTVSFNRATLVNPGTAADTWSFTYNGVRVVYTNEYNCLRVRGIPDLQVPARFMSHVTRDNTSLPTFQVGLSDATTYWFQVLADGSVLGPNGLSMLPTAPVAVTYVAAGAGNAATINDGNVANTGAPYAVTTTLEAANRRVHLDGSMANNSGVAIAAQTTLFTVDAAHRPTAWVQFTGRTSTNLACRITVKGATGAVCIDQSLAAGATLSFDGANWRKS